MKPAIWRMVDMVIAQIAKETLKDPESAAQQSRSLNEDIGRSKELYFENHITRHSPSVVKRCKVIVGASLNESFFSHGTQNRRNKIHSRASLIRSVVN
jgi:hypothetical protein